MINILVIEDDKHTRKLMMDVLNDAGYLPYGAEDGVQALEIMDHTHIDIALVDLMMPHMDGYEFTQTLREGGCAMPILMVTAKESPQDKKRGFIAGTDDYMVKPVDEEEMLLRITALLRRSKIVNEHKLAVGGTVLDYDARTVSAQGQTILLPQKEFLLLFKLLSYPDKVFTRRQLMDEIWDMDSDSDERTVDVHINRLRDKYGDSADFQIKTIRGLGYEAVRK